ncbi:hypothetical protein BAU01nite_03130 [Brevibacterium aurantiacum]|nr:hypothetical protein BAU01nite_03130 [Brevibacterium aurantiacum]
MFVGAFRIDVQESSGGDEVLGNCRSILLVEGTQLAQQLLVELLAGDLFGDRRLLDPRTTGTLLACVFAGFG